LSKAYPLGWISIPRKIRMLLELIILVIYPLFSILALFALRQSPVRGTLQFLWALLIIVVPFLGPLAFFIVNPSENTSA